VNSSSCSIKGSAERKSQKVEDQTFLLLELKKLRNENLEMLRLRLRLRLRLLKERANRIMDEVLNLN
jgi:hypothetical protein